MLRISENWQKKKLPSPIFHYIDGGSDDEITIKTNTIDGVIIEEITIT